MIAELDSWRPRNAEDAADSSHRSALDPTMSRNGCLSKVRWIDPDIVPTPMMVQLTTVHPQMTFELAAIHGGIIISVSRRATAAATVLSETA